MKALVASITQRSQVTIPAEVRRKLGLKPRDKVAFVIEGDQVRLEPVAFTLETAFGCVTPLARPGDFEERVRQAKEARIRPKRS
jgi:antitoxin PrlF